MKLTIEMDNGDRYEVIRKEHQGIACKPGVCDLFAAGVCDRADEPLPRHYPCDEVWQAVNKAWNCGCNVCFRKVGRTRK